MSSNNRPKVAACASALCCAMGVRFTAAPTTTTIKTKITTG